MDSSLPHVGQVKALCAELDKRATRFALVDQYVAPGGCPIPQVIAQAQATKAYRMLMAFAQTNYAPLIIRAAASRLEVGGIRNTGSQSSDDTIWGWWQDNHLDSESRLAHDTILTHGRAFAIVWPTEDRTRPTVTIEDPTTCVVEYREGSRYERASALRRWVDADGVPYATLYREDGIYKYVGDKDTGGSDPNWKKREVENETWPLEAPGGVIPVVELATNRQLKATRFGYARGDYEQVLGLLDRINVLEFLRLVIAFTAGFPIRAVIGDKIKYDDDETPIAPFKLAADVIAQLENPNAKIVQIDAADVKSFGEAIDHDVETLAGITQTPAYYLRSVPIQNVSADAIRASDAPLNARVADHKPNLDDSWEEVLRTGGLVLADPVVVSQRAELVWVNRESRSLAERADAATKLATVMPWQAVAEIAFDATQDQISRWEAMRQADTLGGLLASPPRDPAAQ